MPKPVLNSAADLYKEIRNRGLHFRKKNGRDNELLKQLSANLGCPDNNLQEYLNTSPIPAETLLIEFLKIAQPFAKMFEEIWSYMANKVAPVANENISVRFGFPETTDAIIVDLEAFRRYIQTSSYVYQNVLVTIWNHDSLRKLFGMSSILLDDLHFDGLIYKRYRPGEIYQLPDILQPSHPIDYKIQNIRNYFQKIILDYNKVEVARKSDQRTIQELKKNADELAIDEQLRKSAFDLTDLLPKWYLIFHHLADIPNLRKDKANMYYEKEIKPLLSAHVEIEKKFLNEAVDILDLPFWKYRWHTYEIWSTILTINTLSEYQPFPAIKNKRIFFDSSNAEIIAHLTVSNYSQACLAVQVQTPYTTEVRQAIKPDLRICFSENYNDITQTAAIIEYKQRESISAQHIEEISRSYTGGAPSSGGTIIINYDEPAISPQLAPNAYFIQGVKPGNPAAIETFKNRLLAILQTVQYLPIRKNRVILLDVSISMETAYIGDAFQSSFSALIKNPLLKIYRFNEGLVPGGDLSDSQAIAVSGGTHLGKTLDQLIELLGEIDQLLIITDGDHDRPDFKQWKIGLVRECMPNELPDFLNWLSIGD
jgi:hypothetical protein